MWTNIHNCKTNVGKIIGKPSITIGEVNGDSKIDIVDGILLMKHGADLTAIGDSLKDAANVNMDVKINIAEAILILKYDNGLINHFN